MMNAMKIDEWALHAFADGEVADDQRAEIAAHLAGNPEEARRVDTWRQQKRALHQAFDGILDESIPATLMAAVNRRPKQRSHSWLSTPVLQMAAAVLLLIAGSAAGWLASQSVGIGAGNGLAGEAIAAHEIYTAEVRHPVEVAATDKAQLETWLSKRIGADFAVPDLTELGYSLIGGRLVVAGSYPGAQLMYEDSQRRRLTILLTANRNHRETALQVERKGQLIACYWMGEKLGFAVAGELDLNPMMKLARAIYEKFEA